MRDQIREPHPDQPYHAGARRADQRQLILMLRQIGTGCLTDKFCSRTHLEHIIKTHKQKRMQHNVDVIQIVKLTI